MSVIHQRVPFAHAAALVAVACLSPVGMPVAAAGTVEVVATGLVNPRGLAQAPNGWIYVAEAGNALGAGCPAPPLTSPCLGQSGAITKVDPTGVMPAERIVTGLPSVTARSVAEASGPSDVSFNGTGGAYVAMGLGGSEPGRQSLGPTAAALGHVLKVSVGAKWKLDGDVTAHEQANDPDGAGPDSNPYGVLALPSRRIVADAGANAIVEVAANGRTRTLAVLPGQMATPPGAPPQVKIPVQAVPTSVAEGPDGYLYVGQLTGFPFPAGGASVWRVPPDGGAPEQCATGFTTIMDVAFDPWGNLYVLEFASGLGFPPNTGRMSRLAYPNFCRARQDSDRVDVTLSHPAGVVIGLDGAAYVTNKSLAPFGTGEVLRIPLD